MSVHLLPLDVLLGRVSDRALMVEPRPLRCGVPSDQLMGKRRMPDVRRDYVWICPIRLDEPSHVIVQDVLAICVQSLHIVVFVQHTDSSTFIIVDELIPEQHRHSNGIVIMLRPRVNEGRGAEERRSPIDGHLHTGADHENNLLIGDRAVCHKQDLVMDGQGHSHTREPVCHQLVPSSVPDVGVEVGFCQLEVVGRSPLHGQVVRLPDKRRFLP